MINQIHNNSMAAFQSFDRKTRCHIVYRVYEVFGPSTDREVAYRLGFSDLNSVRPRITEMIDAGHLKECGNKADDLTGKSVRLVRIKLASENDQPELFGLQVFNNYSHVDIEKYT